METGEKSNSSRNSKHSFRGLDKAREAKVSKTRDELNGKKIRFKNGFKKHTEGGKIAFKKNTRNKRDQEGQGSMSSNLNKDATDDNAFFCTHCGQSLSADEDMGGMRINCPACGKSIVVPELYASTWLFCQKCGNKLEVLLDAYAKAQKGQLKIECPKCKQSLQIVDENPDQTGSSYSKLHLREARPPSDNRCKCPFCGNLLGVGARVCPICRVDLRTGAPAGTRKRENNGGIGRLAYFLLLGLGGAIIYLLSAVIGLWLRFFISIVYSTFIVAVRLINIGKEPAYALLGLVPIANLVIGFWCAVYPEGYEQSREMDSEGVFMMIIYVILMVLALFGLMMFFLIPLIVAAS